MDRFIVDNIRYLYERFGITGIMVLLSSILFLYFIFELVRTNSNKILGWFNIVGKRLSISDSIIFHKLDVMINFRVDRMRISCPLRYKIFSDIIKIKLNKKMQHFKSIKDEEIIQMDNVQLKEFWENIILLTEKETLEEWVRAGIPAIAIVKYQNFCQDSAENIFSFIGDVCNSNRIYESNIEKSIAILDFIAGINDMSLISAEKAILQINGELNKTSYLGIKCEVDCKVIGCEHRSAKNV